MTRRKSIAGLFIILGVLALIQLLRFGLKELCFLFLSRNNLNDRVASALTMVVLIILFLVIARVKHLELSVFPKRFHWGYIVATIAAAALLIATPIITKSGSASVLFLLAYSAILTPIFEELIFRSFVWNRLNALFHSTHVTYLLNALLFALWHFGYADALLLRTGDNFFTILCWKAVTGLCFGLVLGLLRIKAKNSYATMLLHGVLNIFGR